MDCRICMQHIDYQEAIGNLCMCKDVFFHETCAIKWFTPRIEGTCKGKAVCNDWSTHWSANCEVCKQSLDNNFVQKCITNLKRETFKQLKNTNPVTLPRTVTVVSRHIATHRINNNAAMNSPRPIQQQTQSRALFSCFACLSPNNVLAVSP